MHLKPATIILLSCSLLAMLGCKKHDNPLPAKPSYTAKMGGNRNWKGYHKYDALGMHYPTPVHDYSDFPESSFAIAIVDGSMVNYKGTNYGLQKADSTLKIHFFGTAYYFHQYHMGSGIMYFYEQDSIVYCKGDRHGTNDYWELTDIYHTY